MDRSEYAKIKISDIPSAFMEGYNLQTFPHNRWVYFEIVRGCYGLLQSGNLAKNLLHTRINKSGYFEAATTPGIWRHTWRPIQFYLIVDDFGIEYVGEEHAHHLRQVLQEYYKISQYWKGKNLQALTWNRIMPPGKMTTHSASISHETLKESFSDLTTRAPPNISSCPTSIQKFTMEPN